MKEKNELKKHPKETVATIIGIEEQNRRGFVIKYEFNAKGKKYTEFQKLTINKELIKIGDKFKIVFSDKNPKNSVLDFDKRITE